MSLEHCSDTTPMNRKVAVHVKVWNSTKFLKKKEFRDTCISTASNLIQSSNDGQFTKLAKQKSRMKDIQIDNVILAHPNKTKRLTNT